MSEYVFFLTIILFCLNIRQEDEQEFDASLMGVTVVLDPTSTSVTQMDVKANEASEFTDFSSSSDHIIKTENISDKKDVPNIQLPLSMESNAEMVQEKNYPSDPQEVDNSLLNAIEIRDAFIFCPISEPIVLNEILVQGIFVSEREMTDLEENKNSISNKFISIEINKEDATRSKRQAIDTYGM